MTPTRERAYRTLFWIAAVYDIALGITFLFFANEAFRLLDVEDQLPDYGGYVALIAAFLFVIGVAYVLIARGDLERNRDLIAIGVLYKAAYSGVALYFFAIGDYPHIVFVAVFAVADLIFLVLMAECWWYLGRHHTTQDLAGAPG